ncbi:MAG: glycerophosphodiester phosphodiesterase [Pseudomonadota bacterium]
MSPLAQHWPYPRWIAHRGAGTLAPENTLAAFALGASHGYRMFECDVKLSADDVAFLLHDDTLARTTDGSGVAGTLPWATLAHLDAGSWHSEQHAGQRLPRLDQLARFCLQSGYLLNLEIKPTPGTERHTGTVVAREVARLWAVHTHGATPPLLSSFSREALAAARTAQPTLPRALLLSELAPDWCQAALALQCVAVICQHRLWNAQVVEQARSGGLRCLTYTVNEESEAQRLLDLGLDGIITDRVDVFQPDA